MTKKLLIVGGAACVWDDLARVDGWPFDATAVINDMLVHYNGKVDYFCTLHPEKAVDWINGRKRAGYNQEYVKVGHTKLGPNGHILDREHEYVFSNVTGSGSSSLLAVRVGIDDGFDRLVLAGVPMTAKAGHFLRNEDWAEVAEFTKAWVAAVPFILGKVKSMSGWTSGLLGIPTREWLDGVQPGGAEQGLHYGQGG